MRNGFSVSLGLLKHFSAPRFSCTSSFLVIRMWMGSPRAQVPSKTPVSISVTVLPKGTASFRSEQPSPTPSLKTEGTITMLPELNCFIMVSLASSGFFQVQTEANVSWVSKQDL